MLFTGLGLWAWACEPGPLPKATVCLHPAALSFLNIVHSKQWAAPALKVDGECQRATAKFKAALELRSWLHIASPAHSGPNVGLQLLVVTPPPSPFTLQSMTRFSFIKTNVSSLSAKQIQLPSFAIIITRYCEEAVERRVGGKWRNVVSGSHQGFKEMICQRRGSWWEHQYYQEDEDKNHVCLQSLTFRSTQLTLGNLS